MISKTNHTLLISNSSSISILITKQIMSLEVAIIFHSISRQIKVNSWNNSIISFKILKTGILFHKQIKVFNKTNKTQAAEDLLKNLLTVRNLWQAQNKQETLCRMDHSWTRCKFKSNQLRYKKSKFSMLLISYLKVV